MKLKVLVLLVFGIGGLLTLTGFFQSQINRTVEETMAPAMMALSPVETMRGRDGHRMRIEKRRPSLTAWRYAQYLDEAHEAGAVVTFVPYRNEEGMTVHNEHGQVYVPNFTSHETEHGTIVTPDPVVDQDGITLHQGQTYYLHSDFVSYHFMAHGLGWHGMTQHGPSDPKDCDLFCSPSGDVAEAPEGVEQIQCLGNNQEESCVKQGSQCGGNNRTGCATNCKTQCCGCCSI